MARDKLSKHHWRFEREGNSELKFLDGKKLMWLASVSPFDKPAAHHWGFWKEGNAELLLLGRNKIDGVISLLEYIILLGYFKTDKGDDYLI